MRLFLFTLLLAAFSSNIFADNFKIKINPQYLQFDEDLGIYFGFNNETVKDKYEYQKKINALAADFSVEILEKLYFSFNYTDSKKWGFGKSSSDYLDKYWYNFVYRISSYRFLNFYAYYSNFNKELFIKDEADYTFSKQKYLLGAGFGAANMRNFSGISFDFVENSGGYGIFYSGLGNFKNKLEFMSTNPFIPGPRTLQTLKAENDLGYVFYMDLGGIFLYKSFYLGGKLEAGGFFNGRVIKNGSELKGEVITGTLIFEFVSGYKITDFWDISLNYKIIEENNRNEGDVRDGSHFTVYHLKLNSKILLDF